MSHGHGISLPLLHEYIHDRSKFIDIIYPPVGQQEAFICNEIAYYYRSNIYCYRICFYHLVKQNTYL